LFIAAFAEIKKKVLLRPAMKRQKTNKKYKIKNTKNIFSDGRECKV